jgi:hypothetical protein
MYSLACRQGACCNHALPRPLARPTSPRQPRGRGGGPDVKAESALPLIDSYAFQDSASRITIHAEIPRAIYAQFSQGSWYGSCRHVYRRACHRHARAMRSAARPPRARQSSARVSVAMAAGRRTGDPGQLRLSEAGGRDLPAEGRSGSRISSMAGASRRRRCDVVPVQLRRAGASSAQRRCRSSFATPSRSSSQGSALHRPDNPRPRIVGTPRFQTGGLTTDILSVVTSRS